MENVEYAKEFPSFLKTFQWNDPAVPLAFLTITWVSIDKY